MSRLTIWPDDQPENAAFRSENPAEIVHCLAKIGVRFEQWAIEQSLPVDADQDAVPSAYAAKIDQLKRAGGYSAADVVKLAKGTPTTLPMRAKFLDEHTHSEDEIRFFVEGTGAFYLRCAGKVHQVICTAGDLISVPARTRHWFDMGEHPHFTAIRLFTDPAGWVGHFTGDPIARRFPLFAVAA